MDVTPSTSLPFLSFLKVVLGRNDISKNTYSLHDPRPLMRYRKMKVLFKSFLFLPKKDSPIYVFTELNNCINLFYTKTLFGFEN